MPATVWILIPSHRDGPYLLLRTGWIARVEQDDHRRVIVYDTRGDKYFVAGGTTDLALPADFGLQLLRALDAARRSAQDADSDRVVAARHSEDSWSWETYAPDEVPPAQADPPPPPSTNVVLPPPPPLQAPLDGTNGSFVPNPKGGMPLWVPKNQDQAEPEAVTE
ncbi:hypothetical protein ACH40E_38295 [Streptomyces acidicola]|uniref:hypothetical protein n=1 Tax=Streptomyces acidicola TaxID=2596892 RepID=UPI00378CBE76